MATGTYLKTEELAERLHYHPCYRREYLIDSVLLEGIPLLPALRDHTNTKMLFTVYSRYVPNLTRQDGSAMERLMSRGSSLGR